MGIEHLPTVRLELDITQVWVIDHGAEVGNQQPKGELKWDKEEALALYHHETWLRRAPPPLQGKLCWTPLCHCGHLAVQTDEDASLVLRFYCPPCPRWHRKAAAVDRGRTVEIRMSW